MLSVYGCVADKTQKKKIYQNFGKKCIIFYLSILQQTYFTNVLETKLDLIQRFAGPTEHGDSCSGGADRHGEQGAGVLALIGQLHLRDGDGKLGGCGAVQLDTVIPQS